MEQLNLLIQMAHTAWDAQLNRANKLVSELSDEQLAHEVAPGRNTGVYLLGHLTAVHDHMLQIMGLSDRLHPELDETFIKNPDKGTQEKPSAAVLRKYWDEVNTKLTEELKKMTPADWMGRHTSVSEEDFAKEPHRNKMNILLSRTNHLSNHLGQMVFLKK